MTRRNTKRGKRVQRPPTTAQNHSPTQAQPRFGAATRSMSRSRCAAPLGRSSRMPASSLLLARLSWLAFICTTLADADAVAGVTSKCLDTCGGADDICQDGGSGASDELRCELGTDSTGCGSRLVADPPRLSPSPPTTTLSRDDSRHAGTRVILGPPMMASAARHNVSFTVAGSIQGNIQDSIVKHEPWLAPGSTLQRLSSARNSGPDPVAAAICAICFVLIAMCMCILWLLLFERYYLRQPPGRLLFDSSRQNLTL